MKNFTKKFGFYKETSLRRITMLKNSGEEHNFHRSTCFNIVREGFFKKIGSGSSRWGCGGGLQSWALGVVLFSPFALFGLVLGLGVWVSSLVWVGVCLGGGVPCCYFWSFLCCCWVECVVPYCVLESFSFVVFSFLEYISSSCMLSS